METKSEIKDMVDIKRLVDTFYDKVRGDSLLGPIFEERINGRWSQHLEKMYKFWQTVLLKEHTYMGNPFPPHALLEIDHSHFQVWQQLFMSTIDALFEGEVAEEAKFRAQKMAEIFEYKIAHFNALGHKL